MQKGQGPMPTVKDQVEQKAGLMATQAAQQAQGAQMQQAAMPPGPVPEGTPTPEAQPEQPVMAARGGLMGARTNFHFAHGGILGFAGDEPQGSKVSEADPYAEERASDNAAVVSGLKNLGYATQDILAMPLRLAAELLNSAVVRPARAVTNANIPYVPLVGGGDNTTLTPYTDRAYKERQGAADAKTAAAARENPDRVTGSRQPSLGGITPSQGIKAALPKAPPAGPRQAPAGNPAPVAGQDQGPPQPSDAQRLLAGAQGYSNEPTEAASVDKAVADQKKLQAAFGTDKPVGEAQQKYMSEQDALQARRQKQAEDLAWSAYVQGTVGTPGSGALAYDTTKANALNQAGEFQTQRYKNLAELDTARRTAAEKQQTEAGTAYGASKTASALERSNKAQIGANLYSTLSQATTSKYNTDEQVKMHLKVAELDRALRTSQFNIQGTREARAALEGIVRDYQRDEATALNELKLAQANAADPQIISALNARLTEIRAAKAPAVTALGQRIGLPAAAPTAGTMAPDRAAQFKVLRPS